jgi:hypothetical protein
VNDDERWCTIFDLTPLVVIASHMSGDSTKISDNAIAIWSTRIPSEGERGRFWCAITIYSDELPRPRLGDK